MDEFSITNNKVLRELSGPFFNDITFTSITIEYNDNLFYLNETFFGGQEETLRSLIIHKNVLGNNGFPYSVLPSLPYLSYLELSENGISTLPVLPSNKLIELRYGYNAIEALNEGTFVNCEALKNLYFSVNSISSITPGKSIKIY